jgi:glucokinase
MEAYCFGVDIGGTNIKLGLFNHKGENIEKWQLATDKKQNGQYILPHIAQSIETVIRDKNIEKQGIIGIGLGVPGPVDAQGTVYKCVNLGWDIFNVREALKKLTGFEVKVENDANVAALGEMWQGSGKGAKDVVMITIGTGIGGSIMIDGQIIKGFQGSAGEIGHMTVVLEKGELCSCGKRGCLETVASGLGFLKETLKYLSSHHEPSILKNQENLTTKDIFEAAKQKDGVALTMVEQQGRYIGLALANVANTIDPELFIIGGGVSKAGDILIESIQKSFKAYVFHTIKKTRIVGAGLGNDAGIIGAARLILQ